MSRRYPPGTGGPVPGPTTADQLAAAEAKRRRLVAAYAQLHQEVLRAIASEDHLRARLARERAGLPT